MFSKLKRVKILIGRFKNKKHLLNIFTLFSFLKIYLELKKNLNHLLKNEIHEYFDKSDYKNLNNSKYLDLDVWVFENLNRTFKLNLHNKTGLKILDISTGFGYFPYICNHFGHSAEGTDLKNSENNLYEKVTNKLKVKIQNVKINKYEELKLKQSYDIITSFMICFNAHRTKEVWHIKEWKFFFNQINKYLNDKGLLYLSFNAETIDEPIDKNLLEYFSSIGGLIDGTNIQFQKKSLS